MPGLRCRTQVGGRQTGRAREVRSLSILRVVADTLVGLECRKNLKANMTGQRALGMGVLSGGTITQWGFIKNGIQVNGSRLSTNLIAN